VINQQPSEPDTQDKTDWLQIAKDSFESSTSYFDANYRKTMERNIALFQSRHPAGSKYNSEQFKRRSRLFRPKTKSVVRKNEAAAAAAFFANVDVVSIEPENDADPLQVASAELLNELVNYRLTKTIPWYMILIGALQEAQVVSIVSSYQYWKYKEKPTRSYEPMQDDIGQPMTDASGQPYFQVTEGFEVVKDEPCIELIPIENIRFDSGANWTDVVNTSPYLIRMVPMYVDEVRQMMKSPNGKTGQPQWKEYSEAQIRTAMVEYDTIRQQRNDKKEDPLAENGSPLKAFEIVWCHENFVRLGGEEVVYWTLGTQHLLTDPQPLKEVYFHGERPVVIGCAVMEAHKTIPDSLVAIGSELQKEANDITNQRMDNVRLVLNKRWIVKRNAQVDVESLMRNTPGGATMANDPMTDVQEINWPDVTASSYQEQDRLNLDYDELTGNFSQGSVQTNRRLNETVGGMQLAAGGANQMTEYLLRTFVETWVEPVLYQLVKLEQAYETDEVVLGIAGERAQLAQKYGINQITDDLLNQSLTVNVNVGMGATDPRQKMGKFAFALETYGKAMAGLPDADHEAIRREVFGLAGYKNGSRFFKSAEDPASVAMKQQMDQMQSAIQDLTQKLAKAELDLKNKEGELQVSQQEVQIQQFDAQTKRMQALKPDSVQPQPDVGLEVQRQFALEDMKGVLQQRLAEIKEEGAKDREMMKLAASIIEASLNQKPAEEEPEGESVAQTLERLMQSIEILQRDIRAPRKKEIILGPNGRPVASVETIIPESQE